MGRGPSRLTLIAARAALLVGLLLAGEQTPFCYNLVLVQSQCPPTVQNAAEIVEAPLQWEHQQAPLHKKAVTRLTKH